MFGVRGSPTVNYPRKVRQVTEQKAPQNEMIERVAKAIWDSTEVYDWAEADKIIRGLVVRSARAAIQAMREPTDEMVKAGMPAKDACPQGVADIYWSMIGAALGERD